MLYAGEPYVISYDGDHFLTTSGVFDVAEQLFHPFAGESGFVIDSDTSQILTWRVSAPGFWLVIGDPTGYGHAELWQVDGAAQAARVGTYADPPPRAFAIYAGRLAGDGTLFQIAMDQTAVPNAIILRRNVSGAADIVYDEGLDPLVRVHTSGLVTGP